MSTKWKDTPDCPLFLYLEWFGHELVLIKINVYDFFNIITTYNLLFDKIQKRFIVITDNDIMLMMEYFLYLA